MNGGGWIETPVADDAPPLILKEGEFVIRFGRPLDVEALMRRLGNPLEDDA